MNGISRRQWLSAVGVASAATIVAACGSGGNTDTVTTTVTVTGASPAPPNASDHSVVTDPDVALKRLMDGNVRFVNNTMEHPGQDPEHRLGIATGQNPFAIILTCSDSRLTPGVIFDQGLGDLFVVRVAGNIVDPALLASVEYAVDHLHTPLVLVMGHELCGAVDATIESLHTHHAPEGSLGALVDAIAPAVGIAQQRPGGLLDNTIRVNAEMSRDAILKSPVVAAAVQQGKAKVLAAYYSLDEGVVNVL
jgi:carbonic anhydrase